jgi:hypothetical protein
MKYGTGAARKGGKYNIKEHKNHISNVLGWIRTTTVWIITKSSEFCIPGGFNRYQTSAQDVHAAILEWVDEAHCTFDEFRHQQIPCPQRVRTDGIGVCI